MVNFGYSDPFYPTADPHGKSCLACHKIYLILVIAPGSSFGTLRYLFYIVVVFGPLWLILVHSDPFYSTADPHGKSCLALKYTHTLKFDE